MSHVTTMTFVIGVQAALRVQRQIADTAGQLRRADEPMYLSLPRQFERLLRENPCRFDATVQPAGSMPVRVIWEGNSGAGLLHVVEDDTLRTVNLILGPDQGAAAQAIQRAAEVLRPIQPYERCFNLIRQAKRPLIASFCDRQGGLSRGVELAMFDFARVFFALSERTHADATRTLRQPLGESEV